MPTPRKPTALLESSGAFLKHPERRKEREGEPQPTGELGDPPDDLGREEKAAWRYLANLLPTGVATNMDRAAFEEMACLRVICRGGRATAAERQQYSNYLSRFGMTPADRSRVKSAKDEKSNSPWDKLMGMQKPQ